MISNIFRFCAVCSSMVPPIKWICPYCWKQLKKQYLPYSETYRSQKTIPHLRLMDWKSDNFYLIKTFIESLKGESPKKIVEELARESFLRFIYTRVWKQFRNPIFIPAPPRQPLLKDHAGIFAESLSSYLGGKVCFALKYKSEKPQQKTKNLLERSKREFTSSRSFKNDSIVFVDDVLTTGYTALAAFKALDKPKNFLICTLAWKHPPDKVDSLCS